MKSVLYMLLAALIPCAVQAGDNRFTGIDIAPPLSDVSIEDMAAGDYDKDGDIDIFMVTYNYTAMVAKTVILRNEGGFSFTPIFPASLSTNPSGNVRLADIDKDGDLDVFLQGTLYRNNGNNNFTGINYFSRFNGQFGDYDHDGKIDLVVAYGGTTKIYRNYPAGTFTDIGAELPPIHSGPALEWVDYDGDGDLDLSMCGTTAGDVKIFKLYENDDGRFFDSGLQFPGVNFCSITWANFDGSGRRDLAYFGQTSGGSITRLYRNLSGGLFSEISQNFPGGQDGTLLSPDINDDGKPDLLLSGTNLLISGAGTILYRNDGSNEFTRLEGKASPAWDNVYRKAVTADFDNDGDGDFFFAGWDYGNNNARIYRFYRNDFTYSASGKVSVKVSTSTHPLGGAQLLLSGAAEGSDISNKTTGLFSFNGLLKGGYTVTPVKAGCRFEPRNFLFSIRDDDTTGLNFVATCTTVADPTPTPNPSNPSNPGDSVKPTVTASSGRIPARGSISLRYSVADSYSLTSPAKTRERIVLNSTSGRTLATYQTPMRVTGARVFRLARLPRLMRGFRFCVTATDPSGNRSSSACASIRRR